MKMLLMILPPHPLVPLHYLQEGWETNSLAGERNSNACWNCLSKTFVHTHWETNRNTQNFFYEDWTFSFFYFMIRHSNLQFASWPTIKLLCNKIEIKMENGQMSILSRKFFPPYHNLILKTDASGVVLPHPPQLTLHPLGLAWRQLPGQGLNTDYLKCFSLVLGPIEPSREVLGSM